MQFSESEVRDASFQYFKDNLATDKWMEKYALKDKHGNFYEKTPDDMHRRLAKEFARMDKKFGSTKYKENDYYEVLKNFKRIVPQGSPMQALGNPFSSVSASNCFVIDAESHGDSISGLMSTITEAAEIMKRRGGVGIDVSVYRPTKSIVNNSAQFSDGVTSICDAISFFGRYIGQSGRQGALMITISDRHPDILNFTKMKSELKKVTGANVSIKVSNDLIDAVEKNEEWELRWPVTGDAKIKKTVKAKELWDTIVEQAWRWGEPGLLFWDNYCNNLPAHCYPGFKTVTTNPCSEIALSAYDSCRLISMNLRGYVKNPYTKQAVMDFARFERDIDLAMYMEDNLVEIELEIIDNILRKLEDDCDEAKLQYSFQKSLWEKIKDAGAKGRRTGLGTHGLADCLNALGIPYNKSDEITNKIYSTLRNEAYRTSIELAKDRGAFPVFDWDIEKDCEFIKRLPEDIRSDMAKHGRRNISLLTVAPTGTVAIMSQTSSGIEPVYTYAYVRKTKMTFDENKEVHSVDQNGDKWHHYTVMHHEFKKWMEINNIDSGRISAAIIKNDRSSTPLPTVEILEKEIPNLPECWKVTAQNLAVEDRLRIIGNIQSYIDHGISQTCNFPKGTPKEKVEKYYRDACHMGLKGVTVYVDGSRTGVLVSNNNSTKEKFGERPRDLSCKVHRSNGHVVLIGMMNDEIYEVFAGKHQDLPVPEGLDEAIIRKLESRCYALMWPVTTHTRKTMYASMPIRESFIADEGMTVRLLTNLAIRTGADLDELVDTIFKSTDMNSFARHVGRVLTNYVKTTKAEGCCDAPDMRYEDGCKKCINCGWSKCA